MEYNFKSYIVDEHILFFKNVQNDPAGGISIDGVL